MTTVLVGILVRTSAPVHCRLRCAASHAAYTHLCERNCLQQGRAASAHQKQGQRGTGAYNVDILLSAEALDQLLVVGLVAVLGKHTELGLVLLNGAARLVQATGKAVVSKGLLHHLLEGAGHVQGLRWLGDLLHGLDINLNGRGNVLSACRSVIRVLEKAGHRLHACSSGPASRATATWPVHRADREQFIIEFHQQRARVRGQRDRQDAQPAVQPAEHRQKAGGTYASDMVLVLPPKS